MQIRLFPFLLLIAGAVYLAFRIWPILRRHPYWGPAVTRLAPQVILVLLLRRALPMLVRMLQSLRWFR